MGPSAVAVRALKQAWVVHETRGTPVFDGGRIGLPPSSSASTHTLKPAIAAVEGSVINEAYCMALGQAMGLQVADAEIILTTGERQGLVVRRYKRQIRS